MPKGQLRLVKNIFKLGLKCPADLEDRKIVNYYVMKEMIGDEKSALELLVENTKKEHTKSYSCHNPIVQTVEALKITAKPIKMLLIWANDYTPET